MDRTTWGGSKAWRSCWFNVSLRSHRISVIAAVSWWDACIQRTPSLQLLHLPCYIHRFKTLGGIFRRMFGVLAPSKRLSWTESFERDFGKKHPVFIEAPSLLQAANLARGNCKFLIVYLPSNSARDEKKHKAFCRTLTDPDVSCSEGGDVCTLVFG